MIRSVLLAAALAATPALAGEAKVPAPQASPAPAQVTAPAGPPKADAAAEDVTYAFLKAPLFSTQFTTFPVAVVGEEEITGQELLDAIMGAHGTHDPSAAAGKTDFAQLLDRLINVRLLVLEAREMGIDDLPDVKEEFDAARADTGRELLQAKAMAGVKAEPAEVERLFQAKVREAKVTSVLVYSEDEANKLIAGAKAGKAFGALVKQLVAEKKGEGGGEAEFLPRAKLQPQVLDALDATPVGGVSAPTRLKEGWAVMRVEEARFPADAKARAEAEAQILDRKQQAALEQYYIGIIKRHAKVDQALLKSLDFEGKKPGIAALAKDQRVLARLKGAKDVTVADLTAELTGSFYHGVENAVAERKANREKNSRFDGLLSRRIVPLEVKATGIPETAAFKQKVAILDRQILFKRFLDKVIMPELKYSEEQVQKYYEAHRKEYVTPGFYRLEALAFADTKSAQAAVDKLRAGTDYKWLAANADGVLPASKRKLTLDGNLYISTALPKELVEKLGGAGKGDYRLFTDETPATYAVHVIDLVAPGIKSLDEARDEIGGKLFSDELVKAIQTWAGKLRPIRGVKVYITKIGS